MPSGYKDFRSFVAIGRLRRDIGNSYLGALLTTREMPGGAYNRVFGPDFQWRHNKDRITGQFLFSHTLELDRPDLAPEWNGTRRTSHATYVWFARNSPTIDWFGAVTDIGAGFRTDVGFIPQAGFRTFTGEAGYEFHPNGLIHRIRPSVVARRSTDTQGRLLARELSYRVDLDARWNSRLDLFFNVDRVRALDQVLPRRQLRFALSMNPTRVISEVGLTGFAGEEIDFDNGRAGSGASLALRIGLRPSIHSQLLLTGERRWLDVDNDAGDTRGLFTADVARLRATYTFTARTFFRGVVQYASTRRDASLYRLEVRRRSGGVSTSALFGYKLNWQTVFFAGYGDERTITDADRLRPMESQFFAKVSYAFQR